MADHRERLVRGAIELDQMLRSPEDDTRLGISLIVPIGFLDGAYPQLIERFKEAEPDQYYYPLSDLHVTIFDFISGRMDYQRDSGLEKIFIELSRRALADFSPFEFDLEGVTFSSAAGLLQGFDSGQIVGIRSRIRSLLKEYGIPNTERYESESAHVTFCRFKSVLRNPAGLVDLIERNGDSKISHTTFRSFELVEHDWYNCVSRKRLIERIDLIPANQPVSVTG